MRRLLLGACLLLCAAALAQPIPIGTWRTHLAYQNGQRVAVAPEQVYCASQNGLFVLHKADQRLQALTKLDGLSDAAIADLAYHEPTQTLVIAYQNGNIDLLRPDEVVNVRTLVNSNRPDTRLFRVLLHQDMAYFATAFGGFELDLRRLAPGDTFEGLGGPGRQFATRADTLYLATQSGILAASLHPSVNRQDPANWRLLPGTAGASLLAVHDNALHYAVPGAGIFRHQAGQAARLPIPGGVFFCLEEKNGLLAVGTPSGLVFWQHGQVQVRQHPRLTGVQDWQGDADGLSWAADAQAGLVRIGTEPESFVPTGPLAARTFRLGTAGDRIVALAGGFAEPGLQPWRSPDGFALFEQGQWANFSPQPTLIEATPLPEWNDWCAAAYDPSRRTLLLAAYGHGLLRWDGVGWDTLPGAPASATGLAVDAAGQAWACTAEGTLWREADGRWEAFSRPGPALDLLADGLGAVWARLANGGLWLQTADGRQRLLRHQAGAGNLRGTRVRALAQAPNGRLWAGTDNGITEFFDAGFALAGEDGSTVFGEAGVPLHQGESVTALAADGGSRWWVGTGNGAWLYDPQGRLLAHFDTENSPLPSNSILSIAVEPSTGEVFFATAAGLASYRGDATDAAEGATGIRIFPNPVPPGYTGLVGISGLPAQAQVRITDAGGRLVWKGQAAGGTAVWDANRYDGARARTGVYTVWATDAQGQETEVGKVAVVE